MGIGGEMTPSEDPSTVEENWRTYLMTGVVPPSSVIERFVAYPALRKFLQRVPADPRCKSCRTPFRGFGGTLARALLGRRPSNLNPNLCDVCDTYVSTNVGGAEVELTMLFADVRGSTRLAAGMNPNEYGRLINRFYRTATDVLIHADALIEKLIGDEVAAMFVPGFAGSGHARRAVATAQRILQVTGHDREGGPELPIGVGVHTGTAFVGAVGSKDGLTNIVALGETVNTAAHLASQAGAGEVLITPEVMHSSGLDVTAAERRSLTLKNDSEPSDVFVVGLDSSVAEN